MFVYDWKFLLAIGVVTLKINQHSKTFPDKTFILKSALNIKFQRKHKACFIYNTRIART